MKVRHSARISACFGVGLLLAACTVVPIEEDTARRAQRSGSFNAKAFVASAWGAGIARNLQAATVPYATLAPLLAADPAAAGKAHGRQVTDGSPWAFVVTGEATVSAVNRASKLGTIMLAPTTGGEPLTMLAGPVVLTSSLRDALPMFDFNDFADQLSFAAANKALNDKALAANAAVLKELKPGDRVRYLGALSVGADDSARVMLPIRVERIGG